MESQLDKWWINGTPNPKPRATKTHRKPKRPKKYIPHRDPLGLTTGQFPIEYMERVTKLIREDDPVPQLKAEANKEVSLNAAPQNVIEHHKRLVHGANQYTYNGKLLDVPEGISAMIDSPYMQQASGPNNTCVFCRSKMHKYQIFCPRLKKLCPRKIRRLMIEYNIKCEMCLGINHVTNTCRGGLEKCNIKSNGIECKGNHCRLLHTENWLFNTSRKGRKEKQEVKIPAKTSLQIQEFIKRLKNIATL